MIKVGDKFKHFDDDFELIGIVKLTGDLHVRNIKNGDEGFMPKKIYYQTQYEQQKQRADELEKNLNLINSSQDNLVNELQQALSESNKRADELEEKIDKNKRLHDAAIKSAGILFSDEKLRADELEKRWSELKNKVEAISISLGTTGRMDSYIMYIHILDTMQQLQEDNNA